MRTTTGAVAQVWRNGARQARLTLLLQGLLKVELARARARRVGTLLDRAGRRDVIDGSILDDITVLAQHNGKNLIVTRV